MKLFLKSDKWHLPSLNASALPNMIFILLFFFMAMMNIKQIRVKGQYRYQTSSIILEGLSRKSLVTFICVGRTPLNALGQKAPEDIIQINDAPARVSDIAAYFEREKKELSKQDAKKIVVSLKIDPDTRMEIVTEIMKALRDVGITNVNYSSVMD